jgi:hypothetical protein
MTYFIISGSKIRELEESGCFGLDVGRCSSGPILGRNFSERHSHARCVFDHSGETCSAGLSIGGLSKGKSVINAMKQQARLSRMNSLNSWQAADIR